ncbi:hypothetical protein CMV_008380 [Castanea mollissima]|uniref:C-JID domain-containing protein n=1 Tax=Castanea mollissima TaxID=60419 RepID=A0A8J4VRV7_9ROSI|nr:hypothetical protein CMV_008380 [Castanea mollissima]
MGGIGGKLLMHNLLQELGKEIVRHESLREPGGRSRLWHYEDILHVLKTNTGLEVVEGIVLNTHVQEDCIKQLWKGTKSLDKLKLIDYQEGIIRKVSLSNAQSILLIQNLKVEIYLNKTICGSSMAAEIPMWFKDQSTSSSVAIEMQSDLNYENKWMGFVLFIVYEVHEHENINFRIFDNSDPTLDLEVLHQFVCHFKTNEGGLKQPKVLLTPKVPYVGPIGFWVNRLASYVHDKEESTGPMEGNMPRDFDCSSSSQRRLQSMQKQHVRQQLFDSMETCLGEPMARVDAKDSSSYILQDCFDLNRIFNISLTMRMAVGSRNHHSCFMDLRCHPIGVAVMVEGDAKGMINALCNRDGAKTWEYDMIVKDTHTLLSRRP